MNKENVTTGCWWLTPPILATQEAEIRRILVQSPPRQIVHETLFQKYPSQQGLVEWLKVKTLSSSPSTAKTKERKKERNVTHTHTHTHTTHT
jgi:hypothetical protein